MKTTSFEYYKLSTWLLFILFFSSCDPALDETMVVVNKTDDSLTIVLEKKGNFRDTTVYYFLYDYYHTRKFVGDSLLIAECKLACGEQLLLIDHGPLGTISFDTKDDGMYYLHDIIDTLYVKEKRLFKEVFDKNNWDLYKDEYRNGGGVSKFSFSIYQSDIE